MAKRWECRYGAACYNTKPEHLAKYFHPGGAKVCQPAGQMGRQLLQEALRSTACWQTSEGEFWPRRWQDLPADESAAVEAAWS